MKGTDHSDGKERGYFPFHAMGSPCCVRLFAPDPEQVQQVATAAIREVLRIEDKYSRYRPSSLLSRINRAAARGGTVPVDEETAALLDYADVCHRESRGRFDITSGILHRAWDFRSGCLPSPQQLQELLTKVGWGRVHWQRPWLAFPVAGMELDLGGIGKEYAADRAAAVCLEAGIRHGLVDLGGDIRVIGPQPDGRPWRVGIRHPRREGLMAILSLHQGAVATSGDYERYMVVSGRRYCHLLDPHSGWPVEALASVTVVAERCVLAGSAATIAMLMGEEGIAWLEEARIPHLWMDRRQRIGGSLTVRS